MTMNTKQELISKIAALLNELIDVEEKSSMDVPKLSPKVEMLTIKECTELVKGLSEHTVRQLAVQDKIPHIRTGQGKHGQSYQIRVSCGYDTKGNHKEQAMTWRSEPGMTERQIQKELNRVSVMFEESCMRGFKSSTIKFEQLAEEWFEEYAHLNLRSTTYERMRQLTKRVYPAIGHLRIDKITGRQLQAFVNSIAKEGANEKTGAPLAPKTIRHNLSFISDVFSYAVKMDLVSDNPCSKVSIPKGEIKEKQIYSQEEMELLLTKIDDEPIKYRAFFYLIAYSDFRQSEMLGLEWKDIDFEHNIISIRRTSNYTAERGTYTDTTKTKRSQRTLKISTYIMDLLRQLKLSRTVKPCGWEISGSILTDYLPNGTAWK